MSRSTAAVSPLPAVVTAPLRRLTTVIVSHPVVDAYSAFVPPLLGVLQIRCELTTLQTASLLSIGSLASGLGQPFFAWLADRADSRLFGAIGLAVAAACLSCIGLAHNYGSLVILYVLGMAGVGAFHPIAAASVGQLSGNRRTLGVTIFFTAGMVGAAAGPLISTRLTSQPGGFDLLRYCMIPGLLIASVLYLAVRRVPHGHRVSDIHASDLNDIHRRWFMVTVLFISNALRYTVNMALVYLFVRWAEFQVLSQHIDRDDAAVASAGSIIAGNLNACTMLGMGAGGLLVGVLAAQRRERLLFVVVPILFAPSIAGFVSQQTWAGYLMGFGAGIGFAALIPVSISMAQRLLPHRTSFASSLTMGGAWAVATVGPILAAKCVIRWGLDTTFLLTAGVLVLSGLAAIPLRTTGLNGITRNADHQARTD
jgi:FSR family fosmidomycin resistance protein-like MFS transporter